ncbi:MAG TPA: peptidoglycan DD-metalloendopeptidase family protein [Armatimonadota bacterium]|jgi:murein DD-endopeptidase MepM/ murein hydrolase activator NlpD
MKRLFTLLLCVVVAVGSVSLAARKSSRRAVLHAKRHALRQQLSKIHQKKQAVRQQLHQAQVRKQTWVEQLMDTQQQLGATKRRIDVTEARLRRTRRDLRRAESGLHEVRDRLRERNGLLKQRLVATQRRGVVSYAAVLFHSADYWDFLSRRRLMARLVRYDVRLVNDIRQDEVSQVILQTTLLSKQAEQKELAASLDQQRVIREGLRQEQADEVQDATKDVARYAQMLSELEANSNQITSFLQRLVDTPEGRARAAIPFRGGLSMPVAARITSRFGMRFHPILHRFKLHTGIDFGVGIGTPIHAAGPGVVVHAGWWGAYGNAVIIDHGGGVTTLYGHMSAVRCSRGQKVSRGEVIGLVGSTGWSTGPHCHFEVRRNGVPVNPLGG